MAWEASLMKASSRNCAHTSKCHIAMGQRVCCATLAVTPSQASCNGKADLAAISILLNAALESNAEVSPRTFRLPRFLRLRVMLLRSIPLSLLLSCHFLSLRLNSFPGGLRYSRAHPAHRLSCRAQSLQRAPPGLLDPSRLCRNARVGIDLKCL